MVSFGNAIVGIWRCPNSHSWFPLPLKKEYEKGNIKWNETSKTFHCPNCDKQLEYDEEE